MLGVSARARNGFREKVKGGKVEIGKREKKVWGRCDHTIFVGVVMSFVWVNGHEDCF